MNFDIAGEAKVILEDDYVLETLIPCPMQRSKVTAQAADCPRHRFRVSSFD